MQFKCDTISKIFIRKDDAMKLNFINDGVIDYIYPPYADIRKQSRVISLGFKTKEWF